MTTPTSPSTVLNLTPAVSPHKHAGSSVSKVMFQVQAALVPATVYAFWLYGWPAINLWVITILSCLFWEVPCIQLTGKSAKPYLKDGSALLTGWLLALTLPPWAPWWTGVMGGLFAIVIAKQVFGGLGQNIFNPAMVARVGLLVSFPVPLTMWVSPVPMGSANAPGFVDGLRITFNTISIPDAVSSASLLGYTKTELSRGIDLLQSLAAPHAPALSWIGERSGSLGETSSILILLGGIFLLARGIITWQIPVAMFAGVAIPAAFGHALHPERFLDAITHLQSGALMLGAFFIATDYVTSPTTAPGKLIFGFGCGFLTFVIRSWGGYPEGVAFAVLLMNILTPLIDRYTVPRVLGRDRQGRPLEISSK